MKRSRKGGLTAVGVALGCHSAPRYQQAPTTAATHSSGPGAPRWMVWGLAEPAEAAGAAQAASAGAPNQ